MEKKIHPVISIGKLRHPNKKLTLQVVRISTRRLAMRKSKGYKYYFIAITEQLVMITYKEKR